MSIRNCRHGGTIGLLALVFAGCSAQKDDPHVPPGTEGLTREVKSDMARATPASGVEAEAVEDLASFAWRFYVQLDELHENFVYSPYSIAVASAMLSAGAAGETLTQMQTALGFRETGAPLHEGQNALSQELESRNREASENRNAQSLRVSNDFWMHPNLEPSPGFLDTLARDYGLGVHLAPFDTQPEESRQAINHKVSEDTEELIPELLPDGSIRSDVVFVLTNALYFKSRWENEFPKSATMPAAFMTLDGGTIHVPTMRRALNAGYVDGDGYVAVSLPYSGRELEMVFVMPDAGTFPTFVRSLGASAVQAITAELQPEYLDLSLPKFQLDASVELSQELPKAGMLNAFNPGAAEFPHIAPGVYISDAFHKARLILDEEGTEAAAATAFVGSTTSAPPQPLEVEINRPFVFFIRDASDAVLFVGHVVQPE